MLVDYFPRKEQGCNWLDKGSGLSAPDFSKRIRESLTRKMSHSCQHDLTLDLLFMLILLFSPLNNL